MADNHPVEHHLLRYLLRSNASNWLTDGLQNP